ncbi:MAG: (Fe-S)-binding protein [Betaproteobacteria bacterium]|nr:(Fe-S)-binding protein [Betaproteobacteria bacterium]
MFDAPRDVIGGLPGAELAEMPRNRKQSFCCGGGGGRAMMKENSGTRINQERVREALDTGAGVVATACPFCTGMLEDGIAGANAGARLRVLDLAELVAGSLQTPPPRS